MYEYKSINIGYSYRGIVNETIFIYDFAVLGFLGSTIPYAEAGNLTGVRVSNHFEGTSRIVLDVSEMPGILD